MPARCWEAPDIPQAIYRAGATVAGPVIFSTTPDLKRNKWGYIEVDPETNEYFRRFLV